MEMVRYTREQNVLSGARLMDFSEIFNCSDPIEELILLATARLAIGLQTEITKNAQQAWALRLKSYSRTELAKAFERAECEVSAFPAPAHLVEYLERARFTAAFAVILAGLRIHGILWQDAPEAREGDYWDYHSEKAKALGDRIWTQGKLIRAATQAPPVAEQMRRALMAYGQVGTMEAGLARLKRYHPHFREEEDWKGNATMDMIERALYQCWLEAR